MESTKIIDRNLTDLAFVMDPRDQVAIAKVRIASHTKLEHMGECIVLRDVVNPGHRFAIKEIKSGEFVRQFGFPFGRSRGIQTGEIITINNIENVVPETSDKNYREPEKTVYNDKFTQKSFMGYLRPDGSVGTRNYYLIVPTSMCASETSLQIANILDNDPELKRQFPNCDGIVAIPHTEGCGCDSELSINRLIRILEGYIRHPNVGGCFMIHLGCEQTNHARVNAHINKIVEEKLKPIDWITIEESGGVRATQRKVESIIKTHLEKVSNVTRQPCPISKLIVGTECGASDSFSGITANPLIGNVVDKVIQGKGSAILSEMPEMVGTYDMLLPRFRSLAVAKKFLGFLNWYVDLAKKMGMTLEANLVQKNIEGGLINNYIKSLGAVLKGGTTVIEDVVDYGEKITKQGLTIMQGPGSDLESVTGLVSSGANIICFSTGQGTPTGNAICPVVKVASNNVVYEKLSGDLDFNAGRLVHENGNLDLLGDELLELVIEVASGKKTASEDLRQRQFQIWTAGKLSL